MLEHLHRANRAYLHGVRPLVEQRGHAPADAATPWRPTFIGRQLAQALERPRRLPAPGRSRPGPTPRDGVLEELLVSHREVRTLIVALGDRRWDRMRVPSPLFRWIRLNVGDVFYVMLRHGERHAGQIERTLAALSPR